MGSGWAAREGTVRAHSAARRTRGDTVLWQSLRRRHGLGVALFLSSPSWTPFWSSWPLMVPIVGVVLIFFLLGVFGVGGTGVVLPLACFGLFLLWLKVLFVP